MCSVNLCRFLELREQPRRVCTDQSEPPELERPGLWIGQWQSWWPRAPLERALCGDRRTGGFEPGGRQLAPGASTTHGAGATSSPAPQDPGCFFRGADECPHPQVQRAEISYSRGDEDPCGDNRANVQTGLLETCCIKLWLLGCWI